ncbi:hypothetical protein J5N97_026153 [Dioscorea zingiberensis]|uniref:Exonuclease 1 n=1 Tax=Dioscorea zingiberensis TaxID=325984 RepID=A0A9D5C1X6_9LILI|nr:hypothetical protein J5N97_026153 [Dioscorea zingiberensis]
MRLSQTHSRSGKCRELEHWEPWSGVSNRSTTRRRYCDWGRGRKTEIGHSGQFYYSLNIRRIGKGTLAEKALLVVLPPEDEFPYAVCVNSEVMSSDGSTSLASKSVRITPMMAHELIQILRKENVEFVVAPYEADAQLAYLSNLDADKGGIDVVITEDSDLIAYGCQAVIFKMDRYGKGEELLLDRVFNFVSDELSFKNFDK